MFEISLLSKLSSCPIITLYTLAQVEKQTHKISTELRKLPARSRRKGKTGTVQLTQGWKFVAKLCWDCSAGSPGKLSYIWTEGVQDGEMQQNVQCVPEKKNLCPRPLTNLILRPRKQKKNLPQWQEKSLSTSSCVITRVTQPWVVFNNSCWF